MTGVLDISNVAFTAFGYAVSYVELLGTLTGLVSVYWASKANVLTWPTGIANEAFLFLLFFQVQLYADMLLQVYFFVVTLYGWHQWQYRPAKTHIARLSVAQLFGVLGAVVVATLLSGKFLGMVHVLLPGYFPVAAAYPYADSFVMTASMFATVLLAYRKIETWYLWIAVDVASTCLFFTKEIIFLTIEYLIFLALAIYGLINWTKQLQNA